MTADLFVFLNVKNNHIPVPCHYIKVLAILTYDRGRTGAIIVRKLIVCYERIVLAVYLYDRVTISVYYKESAISRASDRLPIAARQRYRQAASLQTRDQVVYALVSFQVVN